MTDSELISATVDGDGVAFKQLVDLYQDKTYSVCLGYLKNVEDAEDTTQEVFIELFRSIYKYKGDSALNTWIYRIAVNKSLEVIRRRKTKKRFSFLNTLFGKEEAIEKNYADFNHPGIKLENKERAEVLFRHIDKLPDNQRTAFQLHKIQEMSYQEISAIMNTSLSSIESLMFRAKKNLQKSLRDYYENDKTL